MKTKLILLLIVFIVACTIQQPAEETQERKATTQEREIEVTTPEFYQLKLQETLYLNGVPFTLVDLKPNYAVLNVDGIERTISETQRSALIKNYDITILEFYYSGANFAANKIVVLIEPITLSLKQYLIHGNEEMEIKNTPLKLVDVMEDNTIIVSVEGRIVKKIKTNSSETLENLKVKNIKSFYSDSPSTEAAIIEVR